jgi:hypothetical protein
MHRRRLPERTASRLADARTSPRAVLWPGVCLGEDEARDQIVRRIAEDPEHRQFLERQVLKMPEYGEFLSAEDIDAPGLRALAARRHLPDEPRRGAPPVSVELPLDRVDCRVR